MIVIHTLKWRGDRSVSDDQVDDEPNDVSIYCRVFIDGKEVQNVIRARTRHENDFTIAVLTICQPVEVVNHTGESWAALS